MGKAAANTNMESFGNIILPGAGSGQAVTQGKQTELEKILAGMSQEAYGEGAAMRQGVLGAGTAMMQGNRDNPWYQGQLNAGMRQLGDQYGMAQNQILENTPVGMTGVAQRGMQRAALGAGEAKATLAQAIANQLIEQALNQAFGGQQLGIQGIGSAAGTFGGRWGQGVAAMSDANRTSANFFGNLIGGKMGGGGGAGGGAGGVKG